MIVESLSPQSLLQTLVGERGRCEISIHDILESGGAVRVIKPIQYLAISFSLKST